MKSTLIVLLVIYSNVSFAQYHNFNNEHNNWYEGEIYDMNGNKKSGYINYNFIVDNLRFKIKTEVRTVTSKNISSFKIKIGEDLRVFYAIPYKNLDSGKKYIHFFELEHQSSQFKVFSRNVVDFFEVREQNSLRKPQMVEDLYDVIYVANTDKEIVPMLYKKLSSKSSKKLKKFDNEKINTTSSLETEVEKYKVVKKKEIIDFFDEDYKDFESFVDNNDIDIKSLTGFIEALEFKK